MICLNPPTLKDLTLNDYRFILAVSENGKETDRLQAVNGKSYEFMSENDSNKFEQFVIRGLMVLHYKQCIDNHNSKIGG